MYYLVVEIFLNLLINFINSLELNNSEASLIASLAKNVKCTFKTYDTNIDFEKEEKICVKYL